MTPSGIHRLLHVLQKRVRTPTSPLNRALPPRRTWGGSMADEDFRERSCTRWDAAFEGILPSGADRVEWHRAETIPIALHPILGDAKNHAMLPTGGGNDIEAVKLSGPEAGCLECRWLADRLTS